MPIYPPRVEPIKKKEQLEQRLKEIKHAVKNKLSHIQVLKAVEKYRLAKLSLLKAKLHEAKENDLQMKPQKVNFEVIANDIAVWAEKSNEMIIGELKLDS